MNLYPMTKRKIHLEYPLGPVSGVILWNAISTPTGLQTWMAEEVTVEEQTYTFHWSKEEERQALLTHRRNNSFIRFHWIDDEDAKSYFELRMEYNELTGDYTLLITDFVCDNEEEEELTDLWNIEVESLLRQCGM